ncbi:MAG TPA: hypothetical protein VES69_12230, partial [Pyrinomonadaceae bacterium]|nr:hypothetical protein [Pyrinomonadaceae bacterium]
KSIQAGYHTDARIARKLVPYQPPPNAYREPRIMLIAPNGYACMARIGLFAPINDSQNDLKGDEEKRQHDKKIACRH